MTQANDDHRQSRKTWPATSSEEALLPEWVIERRWYDRGHKTSTCICTENERGWWMGHAPHCVRRQSDYPDLRPDWLIEEEDGND